MTRQIRRDIGSNCKLERNVPCLDLVARTDEYESLLQQRGTQAPSFPSRSLE